MTIVEKDLFVENSDVQVNSPSMGGGVDAASGCDHLDMKAIEDRVFPRFRRELNAILGFAEILDSEGADQVAIVEDIRRSAQKLVSFLELYHKGIFQETSEYEYSIRPCSISEILQQIDILKRPEATKKGIEFKIVNESSVGDRILCDREWLELSLGNIVDNAIGYTSEGHVTLTVGGAVIG